MAPQTVECAWRPWSREIARLLEPAARRDALGGLDMLASDVLDGSSSVFGVFANGVLCAAVVLRLEAYPHGRELLVQAAAGRLPGVSLLSTVYPAIERVAVASGCRSVRFQTSREGLGRAMARHGFALADRVFRKVLA